MSTRLRLGAQAAGAARVDGRPLGKRDFTVDFVTTTASSALNQAALKRRFETVTFPAARGSPRSRPTREVYVQKDYANDAYPRRPAASDLYGQAALALSKNEFPAAEAKAREALTSEPGSPTLQTLLGRAVLGVGKRDEAAQLFRAALKAEPLPLQATLAHLGLGKFPPAGRFAKLEPLPPRRRDRYRPTRRPRGALKAERGPIASVGEESKLSCRARLGHPPGVAAVRPLICLATSSVSRFFVAVEPTSGRRGARTESGTRPRRLDVR